MNQNTLFSQKRNRNLGNWKEIDFGNPRFNQRWDFYLHNEAKNMKSKRKD